MTNRFKYICGALLVAIAISILFTTSAAKETPQLSSESEVSDASHASLNVVILGDSETWIGGDDCSKPRGWSYWFARKFRPASCRSYARSGATWTNTLQTRRNTGAYSEVLDDQNVIYNQVARLTDAVDKGAQVSPDIIIIAAGTNDAWFHKKRPGVFAETPESVFADQSRMHTDLAPHQATSLAASIRLAAELLIQRFPEAQIVMLTPPQSTAGEVSNLLKVNDIITESGKRLSIPVIDVFAGGGTYRAAEATAKTNTTDGIHTSEAGARRNGNFVASQLESVLLF